MKLNTTKIKLLQQPLTQNEFADKAGLSRAGYVTILGRGTCHPESLIKIANALGVTPEEILKED